MLDVRPFRAWYFDNNRVDMSSVLAPPYDVIDEGGRAALANLDPHNCVRLILPEGEGDTKYSNAAKTFESWCGDGTLVQSREPAIYVYHQDFEHPLEPSRKMTRRGFIAAVRLHDFAERVILPHERTLKGPKIDRLKLMDATRVHTSQIFTMYSDPEQVGEKLLEPATSAAPIVDGTTADGTRHRLWEVSDKQLVAAIAERMRNTSLYIADGHHRYETMLAFRDKLAAEGGELSPDSSARFGTLFIANMEDPGMVVLPTHRLVHSLAPEALEGLADRGRELFDITEVEFTAGAMRAALEGRERPSFIVATPQSTATVWTLRGGDSRLSGVLADLDVTVLHELVLEDLLGIDKEAQAAKSNIKYIKSDDEALAAVTGGEGQLCFVMRATPLSHVRDVSDAGEFMPQKSTFFVPKIASGTLFRAVSAGDTL